MATAYNPQIPTSAIKVTPKETNTTIYLYEGRTGKPCALAIEGRASKPRFRYQFASTQQRDAHLAYYIQTARKNYAEKLERAAVKATFQHTFKVGDILDYSWGYDQTNYDFVQVTKVSDKFVWARELKTVSAPDGTLDLMYSLETPLPNEFTGPETRKTPMPCEHYGAYLKMPHGIASLWDGKPKHATHYA